MGVFDRTDRQTPDGRWVYKNANGEYLYFWYNDWLIGSDYTSDAAAIKSTSGDSARCPTSASSWKVRTGSTWDSFDDGIDVAWRCPCETVLVTGAEQYQPASMGVFDRLR